MLSGVNNEKICREAERLGAISYHVKPHSFNGLIDLIRWVLSEKLNKTTGIPIE
jgi:DNA-binding NtrC family response regulator